MTVDLKVFKKCVNADTLDLDKLGWSSSRDDDEIRKYLKKFFLDNYGREIDDDMAFILVCIIDDLLVDIQRKQKKVFDI